MSVEPASLDRLAEVLRLVAQLADRVLDAQIMGRPLPPEQVAALVKAARLLQDHGVEWPPLLAQVIHDLAGQADKSDAIEPVAPAPNTPGEPDLEGLTRFFAGFRKSEGSS